jgi:hypothetical protein
MVDKGVSWNVGRVFFGDEQVYRFDLLPEAATSARPSSTCSSTTWRATWRSAPRRCR